MTSVVPVQYYIFETYAPAGTNPPHAVTAVTAKVDDDHPALALPVVVTRKLAQCTLPVSHTRTADSSSGDVRENAPGDRACPVAICQVIKPSHHATLSSHMTREAW